MRLCSKSGDNNDFRLTNIATRKSGIESMKRGDGTEIVMLTPKIKAFADRCIMTSIALDA